MAMAGVLAAPAVLTGIHEGTKLAESIAGHVFAALGTPLLSVEQTYVRKRRVVTTKASLPAWFVVGGLLGGAAALWISGMGLRPGSVTRVVHHPETGHWEPDALPGPGGHPGPPIWIVDHAAWDETVTKDTIVLTERPRMLLPFTSGSGDSTTTGLPDIPAFIGSAAFPDLSLFWKLAFPGF